jgi:HPr kinase/phosphorylase
MKTLHGTTVAINNAGVLLCGPSGCGKSDLALRLIDYGAELVADDRSALTIENGNVIVRAPKEIRGKLEVRGLGIVSITARTSVRLALVVELGLSPERLPAPDTVRLLRLSAFEASTPAKIRLAVRAEPNDIEA